MKSIFSKYIVSFVLVLGIGFVTIAAVLSSVITNYSSENKKSLMENTAKTIYSGICSVAEKNTGSLEDVFADNAAFISKTASPLAEYAESVVIVTNSKGNILLKEGTAKKQVKKRNLSIVFLSKIQPCL